MIAELRLRDLGVIVDAQLDLGPGLTVISGETGAGKTMLLTGLDLLSGGKADARAVRVGATEAVVEGRFEIDTSSGAAAQVDDAGGVLDDDGSLLVMRTVAAQGRSRTVLGGRGVPQAVLGELTSRLVTIHGQSDQLRLRGAAQQRAMLDAYGGAALAEAAGAYRELWQERQSVAAELDTIRTQASERAREAELLRLGLAEVERVAPQPGEDVALVAEADRLRYANELGEDVQVARTALVGGEDDTASASVRAASVAELLETAARALERAGAHDPALAPLVGQLRDVGFRAGDVATELSGYLDGLESDPARLEQAEARRAELAHLTRSYGETVDEVLAWASSASLRLLELDDDTGRADHLAGLLEDLELRLAEAARVLHERRAAAAAELSQAVDAELEGLAMTGAHLDVSVTSVAPGPTGADAVELLLRPHPGAPARPLAKGASGGELSRIMLALEVSLAARHDRGGDRLTMVFDEVDAGVGGKAATQVGARLARLAEHYQVIVITHLAQVAAFAGTHVVVAKSTSGDGQVTRSDIRTVDGDDRLVELARMLSGSEDSQTARAHASELLAAAVVRR